VDFAIVLQIAVRPPSRASVAPLLKLAWSVAKNTIASAVSLAVAGRPSAHVSSSRFRLSRCGRRLTANQSKSAVPLAFSALQCATCVPNLALIRSASEPVAPFPQAPSEPLGNCSPLSRMQCEHRVTTNECLGRAVLSVTARGFPKPVLDQPDLWMNCQEVSLQFR
jgi:hypothetical protein